MKNKKFIIGIIILIIVISFFRCGGTETEITDSNTQNLETALKEGSSTFWHTSTKLYENGDDKVLNVTIQFHNDDVFRIGTMTAIRNLVLMNLEGKYEETLIKLKVYSDEPWNLAEYEYNGRWDKEVK